MGESDFPGAEHSPESHRASGPAARHGADSHVPRSPEPPQSPEELKEEDRKIRRLQMMMSMVMQVIAQDMTLTVDQASEMVSDTRRAALALFPDKELAFNLIYWPRLQRLMRERYRMQ